MVRTDKIAGLIAERGLKKSEVARAIGRTPQSFGQKMISGKFTVLEAQALIDLLNIEDPAALFFSPEVAERN